MYNAKGYWLIFSFFQYCGISFFEKGVESNRLVACEFSRLLLHWLVPETQQNVKAEELPTVRQRAELAKATSVCTLALHNENCFL